MPRFLVYAPDYPNVLEKRMSVRPEHKKRAQLDQGINVYGGAILASGDEKAPSPDDQVDYAGSFMVYVYASIDQAWTRVKEDIYWTSGVWDKDRVAVELLEGPMFRCTWHGCDKSFAAREQLDRHEVTHTGRSRPSCSICGKTYSRSDVLSRHMVQRHGSAPSALGRPRKVPCLNCVNLRIACAGKAPEPCQRCVTSGITCQYEVNGRSSASPSPTLTAIIPDGVGAEGSGGLADQVASLPSSNSNPADTSGIGQISSSGIDSTLLSNDWFGLFGLETPSIPVPGSLNMGWNPMDNDDIFAVLNTHAPSTPTWGFWDAFPTPETTMVGRAEPHVDVHGTLSDVRDGQPFDSPWPHIDKPRTSDASVSLPQTHLSVEPPPSASHWLPETARQSMLTIILRSHSTLWPIVDTVNYPSSQTLTVCMNLYHRHFHNWLPLIEKESYSLEDTAPLLSMAMAAVGAMYSRDDLQGLGLALSELVRRAVVFIRENDRRFMLETSIAQAYLLQTYLAFYCGRQKPFHQAEYSRGVLVVVCKRMHLLRPGISAVQAMWSANAIPDPAEILKMEKEDRRRARLGWCIYLLDCQLACLLNLPAQLSLAEIQAPFPSLSGQSETHTFAEVLDHFLTHGTAPIPLDDLGHSVMAYTLYRICMDAAALQSVHRFNPRIERFRLSFPPHIKHDPQTLLSRIAVHTLNSALPPTPLLTSSAALAHHSHMQFTHPDFIQLVKIAAGKSGTLNSREAARRSLGEWINGDRVGTRQIFLHAAMLTRLISRFTFDSPPEAIWLFDATLCMWAILDLSDQPIATVPSSITISWSETVQGEHWVANGGGVIIQGIGDVATLTATDVVRIMAARLEALPWGLSLQYREILLSLLRGAT